MEEEGLIGTQPRRQIPREVIFTAHTPVPAGHGSAPAVCVVRPASSMRVACELAIRCGLETQVQNAA